MVVVAISIICGFIVALYSIKTSSVKILHSDKYYQIETEITMLQQILRRYKLQGAIIDRLYNECDNEKAHLTLLTKLNTLDKQTYKIDRQIDNLQQQLNQIW